MVVKTAKTKPGKWGLQQKIKEDKKQLKLLKKKGLKLEKKDLKELKRQASFGKSEYPLGLKYEKRHDKGWGEYEKGEHYAGGGSAKKGLGRAFMKGGKV